MRLLPALRRSALERPHDPAFLFLANGEDEAVALSFCELDGKARAIGALLHPLGVGSRVLLLFPPGLDFLSGFLGCLYAGSVAVPAYPPQSNRSLPRLERIVRDSRPSAILTTAELRRRLHSFALEVPALGALPCWAVDEVDDALAEAWRQPELSEQDLALLQYTSGSTSLPKGVMVSHGNLLHNEEMIRQAFGQSRESVVVSWLPPYHDMGLIGGLLQPLYTGARCVLMSPMAFLQKPLRWLQAISRYRGTTSGGPNFAYELCLRRVGEAERGELELSSWTLAFNGAEPVRANTLERFAGAFSPYGFRKASFYPCYGLAEATLLVTGGSVEGVPREISVDAAQLARNRVVELSPGLPGARSLVSCGRPLNAQRVCVVDPESGAECPPYQAGEIRVEGPSVAQGYWSGGESGDSQTRFATSPAGGGRSVRTGDLGFLAAGELFVTGRLKDLIIVRGRNHYPQDLELTVERSHPALRPQGGAAFSIEVEGDERVVLVHEVGRHAGSALSEVAGAAQRAVAEEHEVQVHEVVLIAAGRLPKTSSGKVQRAACRAAYLDGSLAALARTGVAAVVPASTLGRAALRLVTPEERPALLTAYLGARVAARLGVPASSLDPGARLSALGLDSLAAAELKNEIEEGMGIRLGAAPLIAPSLVELAGEIAERLLAEPADESAGLVAEPGAGAEHPLSFGQEALWFLYGLAPESAAYNLGGAAHARGTLDGAALRSAVRTLSARHPILRATFADDRGGPVQRVEETGGIEIREEDAAGWPESLVEERAAAELARPFDLARGPLARLLLLRRGATADVIVLVVHHIAADLGSLGVLTDELGRLYAEARGGEPARLASLQVSYFDYVRWERRRLAGPEGSRLWSYWRRQLAGGLPVLELPTDRPRPPVQTYRGVSRTARIPPTLAAALFSRSRESGSTLSVVLLAAQAGLLHRHTGQEELLLGLPTGGRNTRVLQDLVGYFVNPVAVRADLVGRPTGGQLLGRIRGAVLGALEHAEYPFLLLAERLQPVRDPSRSPIFQTMFVHLRVQREGREVLPAFALGGEGGLEMGGMGLTPLPLEPRAAQVDLTLETAQTGSGLTIRLIANADLFDGETVSRMLGHFQVLLGALVAGDGVAVADLPLLTEAECRQLTEWGSAPLRDSGELCLHELIAEQARRSPQATALVWRSQAITYGELERRAGRLAALLARLDVGPEVRVGLCAGRTVEMVVGMLGILKSGGAYVPLDPSYPRERLAFMLEDSRAAVLLTQGDLAAELPTAGARTVSLDAEPRDEPPGEAARPMAGLRNLAYLIYTSGSTGRPKAVAIEHRSAVALVHWAESVFSPAELAGVLAATSICFDLSVFELLVPLCLGGKVVLAENALELPALAAAGEVRLVNTVPSAAAELVRSGALPATVGTVNLAGEPLPRSLVCDLHAGSAARRVINLYGPSEDTTYSTFAIQRREETGVPPIGRPVGGTRLYLLDGNGRRVPVGVPGEIWLGGEGLARGYWERPELTAERFVPDPFAQQPGDRLYRTGDLARLRPGGDLEFLGRADHQVKVRGFRIELGEVEAVLRDDPAIREAAVLALGEGADLRLVAYLVPAKEELDTEALREALRRRLPEHMVPRAFVPLAAMPLSPSGKVDRGALRRLEASPLRRAAPAAPRTPLEELLCGLWAEVLGVETVGIRDSFFELGGHSLLAVRVVSRIRERLALEISFRDLFETPTVAALARRIERARESSSAAAAPPVLPVPRDGALPLSFAQQRLWLLDRLEPGSSAYNMPAALRLAGLFDERAFARALGEVVRRHEALRTVFPAVEGEPVQVVMPVGGEPLLPTVDLAALPPAEREVERLRRVTEEARRPFDLAQGPLLRATLLRCGDEERTILLTLHHVAGDGWSIRVLARELTALYAAFAAGEPSPLPALPVQYADFAHWQHGWLQGEILDDQLRYWRGRFRDLPPPLDLPAAKPRGSAGGARGAVQRIELPAGLSEHLRELGRREGATPFITLLAAFQALLCRYTGQTDLCVGTPVAGRNRLEVEGLIGPFLNTLPIRVDLSGDPPFRQLLTRVREACLEAFAHQDLPIERMIEELRPGRDLQSSPLFQVLFNMLEAGGGLELLGREIRPFGVPGLDVKLELTLYAAERAEGLELELHYDTRRFDEAQMARMAGHLRNLLAGVAADPDGRLSTLSLAGEEERAAWRLGSGRDRVNGTWARFPAGEVEDSIASRFIGIARAHAGRAAVVTASHRWTYGELDRLSDRAARALAAEGGAGGRVALLFAHDAPMVAGLLAALKAGKTYVPLDPLYPRLRLAAMLEDSGAETILADAANLPLAHQLAGGKVEILEMAAVCAGDDEARPPLPAVAPEAAAYILYTSGSTGEPKGVVQSHRNVLHHIRAYTDALGIVPADRLSLLASYSFDAAVMDVLGALLNGAALCPFSVREHGAELLPDWAARERITIYHSTPTLYRRFVENLEESPSSVRLVVLGGERTLARDLEQFARHFPEGARFVNGLGPTECTLALQFFTVRGDGPRATVPVGYPVQGIEAGLCNDTGEQVAVYGIGEIVLRSPYLALGYWRRPELTAAAFQADPKGNGGRVYHTGDLGRRLPDGSFEFVGRNDAQVKIRGHRIETGEVENRLSSLPGVAQAVVVAREGVDGELRLMAYWIAAGEPPPGRGELVRALRLRLPEFMVPEDLIRLERWPLTPTGKVDRAALPLPGEDSRSAAVAGTAPRNDLEEILASLWAEVLRCETVGVRDDFFELGGHSLLATQLVARLRRACGLEIPLRLVFEAPTVAAMAERIAEALRGSAGSRPVLVPAVREGDLPLSFGQQRLWFLDQLQPGSAAYNMVAAIRLSGRLDAAALAGAFGDLVRRHESLRTTFIASGGEPVQAISPSVPTPLPRVDLDALPAERRGCEADRLARWLAAEPFDLARGPLLRLTLLRLTGDEHLVVVAMHHIVSDGWSLGILAREIAAFYAARLVGGAPSLPALPVQYADFAAWQRRWLDGAALAAHVAYWREQLRGLPPRLGLPADRPRPAAVSLAGGSVPVRFPAALSRELGRLAARQGSTLFMLLLAAFEAQLGRSTGEEDFAVGTPTAGRTQVEVEGLIGLFVNTLALRADLAGDPPVGELLRRVRTAFLAAHAHQDLPFEKLVEELHPERSLDVSPLFQVMLTLQNARHEPLALPGLALEVLPLTTGQIKLDLSLTLTATEEGLAGTLEYASDLFDVATAARMAGHLETLLAALGEPGAAARRLSELPLLGAGERHQLLVEWSDTAAWDRRDGLCLHHLIEQQMALTPGALAVISGEDRLTYGELDRRSGDLAARLAVAGVGRGCFVPVLIDCGPELAIAWLAILRTGAAFVPLDPEWPTARRRQILDEVGGAAVLTDRDVTFAAFPGRRLAPASEPGDPIYAIYTSGSTGRPKGVVVPHRGIVNRFLWMDRFFGAEAATGVLQTTRSVYDSAVWQIFWPLTRGGTTVLTDPRQGAAPEYLLGLVERHRITLADFVPAVFQIVVEQLREGGEPAARFASLRAVVVGGEEMEVAAARTFRRLLPAVALVNLYGPTEASIGCIRHCVEAEPGSRVPIGRPIANVRTLILDRWGSPAPAGVPGELCLAGRCLGLGYLESAEQTARAFAPHPSPGEPGERIYRTGDLARHLPDGAIDFLGRIDQQVKIRGLRIELQEIEALLRERPGVLNAAVMPWQASPDHRDLQLVAYVVPEPGSEVAEAGLREHLRARLPLAMIPSRFMLLGELPSTAAGKLDRRALPAPERAGGAGAPGGTLRTPTEEILAGLWAELLDLDRVDADSDFFVLGGHSLLAARLISRLRPALGVDLPLRAVFESPILADLARRAEAARRTGQTGMPPPIAPLSRERELPLSFGQERLWFLQRLDPASSAYNLAAAFRLTGRLQVPALARCLAELLRRHEPLRTSFPEVDGRPVQVIAATASLAMPLVDLAGLAPGPREAEARRLGVAVARSPFDLARGPLLRLALLRLAPEGLALVAAMHHIVSDGWSIGVLARELGALYSAGLAGEPSPLPGLAVQYADYAAWQRQWLRGEVLEGQLAYWRRQLAGSPESLTLPARVRPGAQRRGGAIHPFAVESAVSRALARLARRADATLFMVLLAAFQTLLLHLTGQEDLTVGSPIANRGQVETEPLIGFFLNTLVLRADLAGDPTFEQLLVRVRETALDAYAHQDVPFERLVAELQPSRSLDRSPLFRVWFVLQNAPAHALELPGLTLQPLEIEPGEVRHDLKLDLTETADGLRGFFQYRTELFDERSIAGMAQSLDLLLRQVTASPELRLSDLCQACARADEERDARRGSAFQTSRHQELQSLAQRSSRPRRRATDEGTGADV